MRASSAALVLVLASPTLSFGGKNKPVDLGHAENVSVSIQATPYVDKDSIRQALGSDLGGLYTVLQVTVTPKTGKIVVDPDDFMLRTDKDGERTHPMAPNQVAGSADMVVHGVLTPTVGTQNNGLVWGGMAPPGSGGKKSRKGDDDSSAKAPAGDPNAPKNDQTLALLKQKSLAYTETDKPLTGFLVFNLEKQKVKDLEMVYTSPEGPLRIRFR